MDACRASTIGPVEQKRLVAQRTVVGPVLSAQYVGQGSADAAV